MTRRPSAVPDIVQQVSDFETEGRQVALTELVTADGASVTISTVVGIDYFLGDGPPLRFFDTLVSGGELDQEHEMYVTEAQAREGHKQWVARVRRGKSMARKRYLSPSERLLTKLLLLREEAERKRRQAEGAVLYEEGREEVRLAITLSLHTARCVVLDQVIDLLKREAGKGPEKQKRGLAAIVGQWPGDETDEEIAAALKELS